MSGSENFLLATVLTTPPPHYPSPSLTEREERDCKVSRPPPIFGPVAKRGWERTASGILAFSPGIFDAKRGRLRCQGNK